MLDRIHQMSIAGSRVWIRNHHSFLLLLVLFCIPAVLCLTGLMQIADAAALEVALFALAVALRESMSSRKSQQMSATTEVLAKFSTPDSRTARGLLYRMHSMDKDGVRKTWRTWIEQRNTHADDASLSPPEIVDNAGLIEQYIASLNQIEMLLQKGVIDEWMVMELFSTPIAVLSGPLEWIIESQRDLRTLDPEKRYGIYALRLVKRAKSWNEKHPIKDS